MKDLNCDKLRSMIARCLWTFAKTMPFAPHEYIVRDKCPLTDEEFVYFVEMQREFGVQERWGRNTLPYLYIDDYKYWTMGGTMEETKVINRAKVSVINDAHNLYEGMEQLDGDAYINEYIHRSLGLKADDRGYNIELINGRLKEISDCVNHLEGLRNFYCREVMREWSKRLSADYPDFLKEEDIQYDNYYDTGVSLPFMGIPEAISVRLVIQKQKVFCAVSYKHVTENVKERLQDSISSLMNEDTALHAGNRMYYKYTSYTDGYECMKTLIERMIQVMDIHI